MKKLHIAGIVFVGLGIVSYLTTSDEDKAKGAGFSSVAAYETAIDAGFDTKAEYDASLEQQRLIAQATDRGFASVAAMQDAEARGFRIAANEVEAQEAGYETKKEYSYFLQQQSLKRTAERGGFASVETMQSARSRGFLTAAAEQEAAAAGFNTKREYDMELEKQNAAKPDFAPRFRSLADQMNEKWNIVQKLSEVLMLDGALLANCQAYRLVATTSAIISEYEENTSTEMMLWIASGVMASDAVYIVEQSANTSRGQYLSNFNNQNSQCAKDNTSMLECANVCQQALIEVSR